MQYKTADVVVLGGGPAGLAAAIAACEAGAQVLLLEREKRLGGILKQCIHDGFGLIRFGEKLSGPEYAQRFIDRFHELEIEALTETFVTKIETMEAIETEDAQQDAPPHRFRLTASGRDGMILIEAAALVLATGCRERTARQVSVHGSRPAGIFTAGTAQHLINLQGQMPTKCCVILGSGDIGLIMARRLTLEGAEVVGVYEAKPQPSGLIRNIHQCLYDFDIPLYLSTTVTRVFGEHRVEEVEVCKVDEMMQPIPGTEERIACDSLILSVGLIPENELAESLGVQIDPATRGPLTDEEKMTSVPGVFSCGNAYRVYDLVDDVSTDGELAGRAAAAWSLRSTSMDGGAGDCGVGDCGAGTSVGKEAGV
ncbi:MAG: NAD(P)/FAD-dependent oxidoreductase [Anaerovoracaceae bacterium]